MKNRIYFFTGTGNSLYVAKCIAESLPNCEVKAIHNDLNLEIPQGLDRVGFVFPTYYWGLPALVSEFMTKLEFSNQGATYFFAIATCAGMAGNALPQTKKMLLSHDIKLNYGTSIRMPANAVFNYDMTDDPVHAAEKSDEKIKSLILNVKNKKSNRIGGINKLIYRPYIKSISSVHVFDKDFNVNEDCISCGLCVSVCPADNITLNDGKPSFGHHCESCTACIQHCPKRAINYKDLTQARRRYSHPQVKPKIISEYYK